eukprot:TRINITY_DN17725_c0_g1_i1.p1 TRINITY_DN17725_c0_g1~~TRINITY_DN17725_c0_g1_i1.p1  ORF type:complete len:632 (-),score=37.89 TRINITY_DN17725_c0_g1_i1:219-2114(-)
MSANMIVATTTVGIKAKNPVNIAKFAVPVFDSFKFALPVKSDAFRKCFPGVLPAGKTEYTYAVVDVMYEKIAKKKFPAFSADEITDELKNIAHTTIDETMSNRSYLTEVQKYKNRMPELISETSTLIANLINSSKAVSNHVSDDFLVEAISKTTTSDKALAILGALKCNMKNITTQIVRNIDEIIRSILVTSSNADVMRHPLGHDLVAGIRSDIIISKTNHSDMERPKLSDIVKQESPIWLKSVTVYDIHGTKTTISNNPKNAKYRTRPDETLLANDDAQRNNRNHVFAHNVSEYNLIMLLLSYDIEAVTELFAHAVVAIQYPEATTEERQTIAYSRYLMYMHNIGFDEQIEFVYEDVEIPFLCHNYLQSMSKSNMTVHDVAAVLLAKSDVLWEDYPYQSTDTAVARVARCLDTTVVKPVSVTSMVSLITTDVFAIITNNLSRFAYTMSLTCSLPNANNLLYFISKYVSCVSYDAVITEKVIDLSDTVITVVDEMEVTIEAKRNERASRLSQMCAQIEDLFEEFSLTAMFDTTHTTIVPTAHELARPTIIQKEIPSYVRPYKNSYIMSLLFAANCYTETFAKVVTGMDSITWDDYSLAMQLVEYAKAEKIEFKTTLMTISVPKLVYSFSHR